ncbi:MAG: Rossmann-like and DUF2520 domain-containing protein [Tunicatimonas sp.]
MIGAGNVAWHLAPALEDAGLVVERVYSRRRRNAQQLADRLYGTDAQNHLNFSDSEAQLFIVAVTDDAIKEVVQKLQLPAGATLVHTSGSQPLRALRPAVTNRTGVLYPVQTFSRARRIDLRHVPLCLESEDPEVLLRLTKLARKISQHVALVNSEERQALHVAAVFANNFTNHLLRMAQTLAEAHHIDASLLHPLIEETVRKALEGDPAAAQTGPAARGDETTIRRHLRQLKSFDPAYAKVYRLLTQHIQESS